MRASCRYAYHGPRVRPSEQTATGGNTTEMLRGDGGERANRAVALAVWEKDDADTLQHKRDLIRRGQTAATRKQREVGKQRRKELQVRPPSCLLPLASCLLPCR